ncbi:hypothetical protein [Mycolicibacterium nivoides]|uniref:Uncharacterized protein n=1 Tax=Mycolicibacterium nivoides TaxID=2487344 RepID=A0ABW9LN95_9MYCO
MGSPRRAQDLALIAETGGMHMQDEYPQASLGAGGGLDPQRFGHVHKTTVPVHELADIDTYRGRRVRFGDITGTVEGLVATAAIGLTSDGQAVPRAGNPKLVINDDHGHTHRLDFGAQDYVTLLD